MIIQNMQLKKGDIIKYEDLDKSSLYWRLGLILNEDLKVERKSLAQKIKDVLNPFKYSFKFLFLSIIDYLTHLEQRKSK